MYRNQDFTAIFPIHRLLQPLHLYSRSLSLGWFKIAIDDSSITKDSVLILLKVLTNYETLN